MNIKISGKWGDLLPKHSKSPGSIDDRIRSQPTNRLPLVIGSVGLPVLIIGMLTLNTRLCLVGAVISISAALAHVVLILRSR
jgi:hypothetical protein